MDDARREEFERRALPLERDLYFAALAMAGQETDALDLVQETLLKAWRAFHTFNRGDNLRAWLFTILRNAWVDRCRARRVEPAALDPALEDPPAPPGAPQRLDTLLPDELLGALQDLSAAHRLVLLLRDVEGLSYKEIAGVLGCPIGSVMSGLHNARTQLREKLHARSSKKP